MRRRFFTVLATAFLCLMTYGWTRGAAAAGPPLIWVALSENGGVHGEAARALREGIERSHAGRIEWREAHWSQFARAGPQPQWVVAVGAAALRGMQELSADDASPPPLLSILVPRLTFERTADPQRLRSGSLSAVFIDQPPSRQIELIRLALPAARKVGILVGAESRGQAQALEHAAKERGLRLEAWPADREGLYSALQGLLAEAQVLLALPDPGVFNSQTAANILTAAYRRQVPLIGFSPAWVRAGALLALYSTPAQVGARGAEMLREALPGRALPPPQWPREFVVSVNQDVARSLDRVVDEGASLAEQLRRREHP